MNHSSFDQSQNYRIDNIMECVRFSSLNVLAVIKVLTVHLACILREQILAKNSFMFEHAHEQREFVLPLQHIIYGIHGFFDNFDGKMRERKKTNQKRKIRVTECVKYDEEC